MSKHDRDIKIFTEEMLKNLRGGMLVLTSLRLLYLKSDLFSVEFLEIIREMRNNIESGDSLSETMTKQEVFDQTYIYFVKKCEMSDDRDYLKLFEELARSLRST